MVGFVLSWYRFEFCIPVLIFVFCSDACSWCCGTLAARINLEFSWSFCCCTCGADLFFIVAALLEPNVVELVVVAAVATTVAAAFAFAAALALLAFFCWLTYIARATSKGTIRDGRSNQLPIDGLIEGVCCMICES